MVRCETRPGVTPATRATVVGATPAWTAARTARSRRSRALSYFARARASTETHVEPTAGPATEVPARGALAEEDREVLLRLAVRVRAGLSGAPKPFGQREKGL